MSDFRVFHNPRCSKSRQTLQLLEEHGIEPSIRLYLQDPLGVAELEVLLDQLGMAPRELLRRGEAEYKELGLADEALSDDDLIAAMQRHPRLIERPIVISGDRAVLGRPPENVLALLHD